MERRGLFNWHRWHSDLLRDLHKCRLGLELICIVVICIPGSQRLDSYTLMNVDLFPLFRPPSSEMLPDFTGRKWAVGPLISRLPHLHICRADSDCCYVSGGAQIRHSLPDVRPLRQPRQQHARTFRRRRIR